MPSREQDAAMRTVSRPILASDSIPSAKRDAMNALTDQQCGLTWRGGSNATYPRLHNRIEAASDQLVEISRGLVCKDRTLDRCS